MQKTKFQIKGMHCNSCAVLIEEKLKDQPGIIKAKASYDSRKAVVIYDEQKIKESEVRQAIEEVGDYQVEKIEKKEEVQNDDVASYGRKEFHSPPGTSNSLKLLTGLVIISLGLNIASLVILSKLLPQKENQDSKKLGAAVGQVLPPQPNPANQQPSLNDTNTTIQTFKITKDNHIRGDFNAPITLVEFSSFECPFCARIQPTIEKILSDYPKQVRHVYKHFPLPFQPNSFKAAEASECANEQGKFWEMHDEIYKAQPAGLSVEKFKEIAKNLKLNANKFNNCLDSEKYAAKVQADYDEGSKKGVQGTPTTFVNGQLVSGALPYDAFKEIIDGELK